ncbi:hypothetical protein AB0368_30805 [Actinoplanes sp. NPDC051475]|uniref:hypothetical protein n=1 Tax=Actinoplanes sp. NPDC051475 TaxID=3157225 RepID=UPI00344D26AF
MNGFQRWAADNGIGDFDGAVAGVRILLRQIPGIGRTAAAMGILLPAAGAVITPLIIAFARSTDYSTSLPVVLTEITLSIAAFIGVTVMARHGTGH